MVKIKIIRHSERLDFTRPFYWLFCIGQYWSDSPLTANGYQMARQKGQEIADDETFNPAYIYTSPYTRTLETGTEIQASFPHSKIVIEPLLAEYQPNFRHRISLYPEGIPATYEGQEIDFSYPETYDKFTSRVLFIISKLAEKHDEDIIIITHGEVLKVYTNYIQLMYPDLMIDIGSAPYLTTISFTFDKSTNTLVKESVSVD
jgi:broad specificity phosphatase PhoE